jgi:arabinofuranan 3-O-arabinosyltransferase
VSAQVLSSGGGSEAAARRISLIGFTLALGFVVVLAGAWIAGTWLLDAYGRPIANDFVDVWAAGHLARDGDAAAAYDWTLHKAAEVAAVGHDFENYYGWHYPPTFFFVASTLAMLPYSAAALVWLGATLPAYVVAVRHIVGERAGIFIALGSPAVLWNASAGQNGYFTAALIGGALGLMQRRPWLASLCLGLLSYKPHLGLLFPLALIAGSRWRVLFGAALVTAALGASSWLVFGEASWNAFVEWIPTTSHVVLGQGGADFSRLQSLFGLVRTLGGSERLAWQLQGGCAGLLALTVMLLWHSGIAFELKAAALSCAALLATPYLYIYDLVALTIPVAFLLRLAFAGGLLPSEAIGLSAAVALLLSYPYAQVQVGVAATVIVAMLIVQRIALAPRGESTAPLTAT